MNGYKIHIKGLNLDSCLIKIYSNKVIIKNLKRISHDEAEFVIAKQDYERIKKYLDNFDCEISELGIKRIKNYLLTHIAVIIALPIIAYFCYVASLFIWDIEITGLKDIDSFSVVSILDEHGIKKGASKNKSVAEIEQILLQSNLFAQVSCYYRGTCLMINVSEKLVYEVKEYQPLKAKYSGIITDYTLEQGTINFVIGEYVNAGDILVHPYMIDKDGNKVLVEPKANICAKIYLSATVSKQRYETILVESGKTCTRYNISFKTNKKSLLNLNNPFVFFNTKVYNKYISNVLPIVRQKVVYTELVEQTKVNDLEALKLQTEHDSQILAKSKTQEQVFLEEITSSVIIDNILYSTTTLIFISSII